MRVHELAKEYGIKSTEFVDIIQDFGIDIKSHLSSLDDGQVRDIRYKLSLKDEPEESTTEEVLVAESRDRDLNETFNPGETVIEQEDITEVELHESEQLEEVVEEVVESLTQEVKVEQPRGFFGWLRSLFS
tara:strand:- start:470 stop:862 length:393 start_codon:yes stop_codon:yes gene_type:complete